MPSPKESAFRNLQSTARIQKKTQRKCQTFEWRRISKPIHETGDSEPPAWESFLYLEEFEHTSCPRPTYLLHEKTLEKVSERVRVPDHPFPPNCHSPYLSGMCHQSWVQGQCKLIMHTVISRTLLLTDSTGAWMSRRHNILKKQTRLAFQL